ncbi:hypothetical protein ATO4_04707 [Aurantimonas sp. 22II-16-19i]|nr:hypothetical protein ATO4_04707 [Aurantimonas sp. 22II-16-19i]
MPRRRADRRGGGSRGGNRADGVVESRVAEIGSRQIQRVGQFLAERRAYRAFVEGALEAVVVDVRLGGNASGWLAGLLRHGGNRSVMGGNRSLMNMCWGRGDGRFGNRRRDGRGGGLRLRLHRRLENARQLFERVIEFGIERLTALAGGTVEVPHRHENPRSIPA